MKIVVAWLTMSGCIALPALAIGQVAVDPPKAANPRPLPYHSETILCRLKNAEEWVRAWAQIRELSPDIVKHQPLDRGGTGLPFIDILDAFSSRRDIVAPIVAKILKKPAAQIVVVSHRNFIDTEIPPEGKTTVSIRFDCVQDAGIRIDRLTMWLKVADRSISQAQLEQLTKSIAEGIAAKLPEASDLFFKEAFEPKLEDAQDNYARMYELVDRANKQKSALLAEHLLSGPQIDERIAGVQQQLMTTQLEETSLKAREDAIKLQIAKEADRLKHESRSDEMIEVLRQLIKLREAEVEHLKEANRKVAGSVGQREIDKANANVLEARIQLLQAQGQQRTSPDQEMTESLRKELSKVVVDRAEVEARLKFLENQWRGLPEMRAKYRDDEQLAQRLTAETAYDTKQLEFAKKRVSELQAIQRGFKPLKLVLPADDTNQ